MAKKLTVLERDSLLRVIARMVERVTKLENLLNGVPISEVKIDTLSVSKLVAGILGTSFNIGEENIKVDGINHRILINDGDYDRILIGDFGDGTYGIKVSQIGKDVKTCEDFELIMSSELNTLKTFTSVELEPNNQFDHMLGFIPIYLYAQYTGEKINYLGFVGQKDENYSAWYGDISVDVGAMYNLNNSGFGDAIKVFIFYDPITP